MGSKMADFQGYIIAFLISLVSLILVTRTIFNKNRTNSRLPPSPMALPIIGHLHLLRHRPHQALHKLSTKHGPLMHIRLGSIPCVVASSPEMAKLFLKTHESTFSNRPVTAAVDYLTYGSADFSFAPYGPYWKFMKKICMSELLSGRMSDRFLPVRREELSRLLKFMVGKANAREEVDVGGRLVRLMNNIVSRMTMNRTCYDDEDEAEEVIELMQVIDEVMGQFNVSDFIWFCKGLDFFQGMNVKVKRIRDKFDAMMDRIIAEHEEAKKRCDDGEVKDLLDVLLDIAEDESSEIKLTKENIKGFIMDIFVAGTDASTIEWALCELINHPLIMKKARQEIDTVVGKNKIVQESDITNLPYLQAIVKETLRLHPPGPINPRESSKDCNIGVYDIPAKTRLFVNVWAIGRDPYHWDEPFEFRPERFLECQMDVRGQHFHFLPFGSGQRACPGITMAMQVTQTSLAAMIQCFDYEIGGGGGGGGSGGGGGGGGGGGESVDMEEGPGLTVGRAHTLMCVPVLRLNPFISC